MSIQWHESSGGKSASRRKRKKLNLPSPARSPAPSSAKKRRKCPEKSTDTPSKDETPRVLFGDIIPAKVGYAEGVKLTQRHFQLPNGSVVLPNCDIKTGLLTQSHRVLKRKLFRSSEDGFQGYIFLCSCDEGSVQESVLSAADSELTEEYLDFYNRETDRQCLHAATAMLLFDEPFSPYQSTFVQSPTQSPGSNVVPLSDNPLLLAVMDADEIGLIEYSGRAKRMVCSCSTGQRQCRHRKVYEEWCHQEGVHRDENEQPARCSSFKCFSSQPICVPLSDDQQQVYREYEIGARSFPEHLVPTIPADQPTCHNGFEWHSADPVERGWLVGFATIYKETCSITHVPVNGEQLQLKVYFRLCTGSCRCKLKYDGQEHMLFNLDNSILVHYGLLFSYLHHMLEGRNPLAACHRAYQRNHAALSGTPCIPLHKLRLAWNSFARLIKIDWPTVFVCDKCGKEPRTVICDGTSLGFRKDLMASLNEETGCGDPIRGTNHCDRVFIPNAKIRAALLKYANATVPMSEDEYQGLLANLLTIPHLNPLQELISDSSIRNEHGHTPKTQYRSIFKDLARNGPSIALLQGASPDQIQLLKSFLELNGGFTTSYTTQMELLQRHSPLLFGFLEKTQTDGMIPRGVKRLVLAIIHHARNSFSDCGDRSYSAALPAELFKDVGFFPALPKKHRKSNYVMDDKLTNTSSQTECRKHSHGHPSLSPGIFTLYCPHGVCYGFQVMTKHESPAVPFDIFKTRFERAPDVIIYDNACRLHAYCLNREPEFFRDTIFVVDRMHWYSHRSCCQGYNINTYKGRLDLKGINTQVNEQENAGLARIKAQLAYMLPDNFIFHAALYLSFRNTSKKK